jgi:hypothetical protein
MQIDDDHYDNDKDKRDSNTNINNVYPLRIIVFLNSAHRLEFYMLENTPFRKLDLFLPSGEGRETPTLLGPLERANLNHWTTHIL